LLDEYPACFNQIAASVPGAPIAAIVVGMMSGRLNDGEQDFIDRMRLEQMRGAPGRVRYTWGKMIEVILFLMAGIHHRVRIGCVCVKWNGTVAERRMHSLQRKIRVLHHLDV